MRALTEGCEAIGQEIIAYARSSLESASQTATALLGAKTLEEVIQLNTDLAKRSFETLVERSAKLSEMGVTARQRGAGAAGRPVEATLASCEAASGVSGVAAGNRRPGRWPGLFFALRQLAGLSANAHERPAANGARKAFPRASRDPISWDELDRTGLDRAAMSDIEKRNGSEGPTTGVIVKAKPKTKKPSMYKVLMLNDDYTPMEFVVHILERFFNKNREEATRIMLHVHRRGVGVCGVYTYEVAETKVTQVMDFARQHQHPLQCTLEKD